MDYPALRRQKLLQQLAAEELDAYLITNPVNVTYLTGFSGESSYLLFGRDRTLLVSDSRFTEQLAEECPGLDVHIRPPAKTVTQATAEALVQLGFRKVGFEGLHLTVAEFEALQKQCPTVSWKVGGDRVEQLRAVKDASELDQIREAISFAERAFTAWRALLRPEDTEKDLADAMEQHIRWVGGKGTSFPTIVAVGERAALPHAPPTRKRIAEAEFLLVDWGASGAFYKSDLTRVLVTRTISPKLEEVYTVVLNAQAQAIQSIRPGARGNDIDAVARSVIAASGYGNFFGHGLGHGVGLQIHEAPAVRPNSDWVLQPGMVVTVEPGIYLPGWGGVRIEDDVVVTPDGCEVLTHVPKELATIAVW
jgi:Xaa-Pro aminopeptidase